MSTIPIFRQADFNNLEFVRQVVLRRLKLDQSWNHLDYNWADHRANSFINYEESHLKRRFIVLANEIMWQLIIQGVITPGKDSSNPNLPFFRITDYGKKVLEAERFIPHDPTGYIDDLKSSATTIVGKVSISYIEEALNCFNAGCHVASVLLLGIAAESVFLKFCDEILSSIVEPDRTDFENKQWVKSKHRWVVDKYQSLAGSIRRESLPESLDVTLTSLYDLIRRQRNELGHPQDTPPEIDREQAFVFFRLFPGFVKDIEAFTSYCKTNGF